MAAWCNALGRGLIDRDRRIGYRASLVGRGGSGSQSEEIRAGGLRASVLRRPDWRR